MIKKTKTLRTDILFWANIEPKKRGSFEDYICRISIAGLKRGLNIKFVLCDGISRSTSLLFEEFKVNYHLLSESEITSKWSMFKIVREYRPKVINLIFMNYSFMMNVVYQMSDCRIIVTDQASVVSSMKTGFCFKLLKRLKRSIVSRSVDHFISVSNYVAERLHKENNIPYKKLTTIYNGVDLERFKPLKDKMERADLRSKHLQIDNDKFVITYVGQLIEEKGISVLLRTIETLIKKYDELVFLIVGKGMLEDRVCRYIKQANNNRVKFLGERDDVDVIFKTSDLAVTPSIWEEAFGFVIAEASACGIPVIGSRIGGIPEVIIDGETGILTTPGDVIELERAIERLLTDRELYNRLAGSGREHVLKNFNLQNMVNQTVDLYKHYT